MVYLFITLPLLILCWFLYTSRDLLLLFGRWALRRRYEVALSGVAAIDKEKNYLILPNHPAIVDPFILVTELHFWGINVRPLVDASFFSNMLARHVLTLFEAVRVPDFRKLNFRPILKVRPTRRESQRQARALGYTILATLTAGGNVLLYPSGHISETGRETIKTRQLAYNVMTDLPEGTRILAVRIRGLCGSMWSRVGGRPAPPFVSTLIKAVFKWPFTGFHPKRNVSLHFEDLTEKCLDWAKEDRVSFNAHLENWYDADLKEKGLDCELPLDPDSSIAACRPLTDLI